MGPSAVAAAVMGSVRWAFRCGSWKPSRSEWLQAARCVQPEEKERIGQFMFTKDAKSAMVSVIVTLYIYACVTKKSITIICLKLLLEKVKKSLWRMRASIPLPLAC